MFQLFRKIPKDNLLGLTKKDLILKFGYRFKYLNSCTMEFTLSDSFCIFGVNYLYVLFENSRVKKIKFTCIKRDLFKVFS